MSVRGCTVIAVEGTHASGKTTLVHARIAYYRQHGVHVDGTGEPARTSPFIEEIVVHGVRGSGGTHPISGRVRPRHGGRPVRRPAHHPAPHRSPP
ncbi:MAG: hypothetical protein ACRDYA_16085 [Egibacteraceae bacterium]